MKKISILLLSAFSAITVAAQTGIKNITTDKMPGAGCDNVVYNKLPFDATAGMIGK